MNKTELEELFYIIKDYSKIKELLMNSNKSWSFNILGKINLEETNYDIAFNFFYKAKNIPGCGYCKFLEGEIEKAKDILSSINDSSSFVNWILFLINLYNDVKDIYPTYFQIRNFYEQDLEMLFKARQYEIIKKILNKNYYLERFNKEIYKYSARVLKNNNFEKEAEELLKKSLNICYKDPETHYILGEIYLIQNKKDMAIKSFKKSEEVNNGYYPAYNRLKDLCN